MNEDCPNYNVNCGTEMPCTKTGEATYELCSSCYLGDMCEITHLICGFCHKRINESADVIECKNRAVHYDCYEKSKAALKAMKDESGLGWYEFFLQLVELTPNEPIDRTELLDAIDDAMGNLISLGIRDDMVGIVVDRLRFLIADEVQLSDTKLKRLAKNEKGLATMLYHNLRYGHCFSGEEEMQTAWRIANTIASAFAGTFDKSRNKLFALST